MIFIVGKFGRGNWDNISYSWAMEEGTRRKGRGGVSVLRFSNISTLARIWLPCLLSPLLELPSIYYYGGACNPNDML